MGLSSELELIAAQGRVFPDSRLHDRTLIKTWNDKLTLAYGHGALRITRGMFGTNAKITDFILVTKHLAKLMDREFENPVLLPFVRDFLRAERVPADFAKVRQWMFKRGLSPAAWKMVNNLPKDTVDQLGAGMDTPGPFIVWLNCLAKTQSNGTAALLKSFSEGRPRGFAHYEQHLIGQVREDVETQVLRLLKMTADALTRTATESKAQAVIDTAEGLGTSLYPEILAGNLVIHKNSTLASVTRERERIALEYIQTAMSAAKGAAELVFPPARIAEINMDGIQWVALQDAAALVFEGVTMRHCVKNETFIRAGHTGRSLFYHAQHQSIGTVCATAEFILNEDGRYMLSQIKGPGNSAPVPLLVDQARQLANLLNS